jgi:hypothetical protein
VRRSGLRRLERGALKPGLGQTAPSSIDFRLDRVGASDDFQRMARYFGVDLMRVSPRSRAALRDAERVCAHCREVGRCRRWFARGSKTDTPRLFCANTRVFEAIVLPESDRSGERS